MGMGIKILRLLYINGEMDRDSLAKSLGEDREEVRWSLNFLRKNRTISSREEKIKSPRDPKTNRFLSNNITRRAYYYIPKWKLNNILYYLKKHYPAEFGNVTGDLYEPKKRQMTEGRKILIYIYDHPGCTAKEIQDHFDNTSSAYIGVALSRMRRDQFIKRIEYFEKGPIKPGHHHHFYKYYLQDNRAARYIMSEIFKDKNGTQELVENRI